MKRTLILMMATLALVTCKKTQVPGPEGPQGPQGTQGPIGELAKGSIYGKVTIDEPNVYTPTLTLANCTVSIADQTLQAITDADGTYTINGVTQGIFDISVTLPDGAKFQKQQYQFSGNGKALNNFVVSQKSSEIVTGRFVDTTVLGRPGIYVYANFDPAFTQQKSILTLFGPTSSVNANDQSSYKFYIFRNVYGSNGKTGLFIEYDYLTIDNHFSIGQQIFITACPVPSTQQSYYYDVYAQNYVYYTAGAPIAPTFSATVQ